MAPKPTPVADRIQRSINVDDRGCWVWQKYLKPNGYGCMGIPGRGRVYVHRAAYETWVGPIPEGLHLDHLCRNRACCNPEHLEAVTPRTNLLRGEGPTATRAAVTHCPQGHPYDTANTYIKPNGTRNCRQCRAAAVLRNNERTGQRLGAVAVAEREKIGARKTSCLAGHLFAGDNLYVDPRGRQQCRTCRREAVRRNEARKRTA